MFDPWQNKISSYKILIVWFTIVENHSNIAINVLQSVLSDSQAEIADKEQEIAKLTKELVQLRLIKAESQALTNGHSAGGG